MIHAFTLNGCNFVVDGNSGSIHVLDDIGYAMIKDRQELPELDEAIQELNLAYAENEIIETYEEIKTLMDDHLLFTPVSDLEKSISPEKINHSPKALCLHVSHDCNLRCDYCFASKGDYNTGRSIMSPEVALKAVDFLIQHSTGRQMIEIDFFGGEPLLNFSTVKKVVEYGRALEAETGKHFYFTITTNGTLLNDDSISFINQHMDNVVISIDGRQEVHDSVRHDAAGRGSYDKILPMAKRVVAGRNGKSYFIRGTFTSRNLDFAKDVFHLADQGFKEISIEPVVGREDPIFIKESDLPVILREYDHLASLYLERLREGEPFRFYHFNLALYHAPCVYKRLVGCGPGYEYLAVSPEGSIYPCHQFVGQDEFVLGNVFDGIKDSHCVKEMFMNNTILVKPQCKDCWAKLFCSGGCHANAWFTNGDIAKPNEISCILQKKRIECAIMVQYLLSLSDENM